MSIRVVKGKVIADRRKFYTYILKDGRVAETKAMSAKEARRYIEKTLKTKIKKAA